MVQVTTAINVTIADNQPINVTVGDSQPITVVIEGASTVVPASTDYLQEGITNLYFTNERVDDRVAALLVAGPNIILTYNDLAGTLMISSSGGGGDVISIQGTPNQVSVNGSYTVAQIGAITLGLPQDISLDAAVTFNTVYLAAATLFLGWNFDDPNGYYGILTSGAFTGQRTFTFQDHSGTIYSTGGQDVTLADGGTGASLVDPNADRIMFWDDSAGATAYLSPGNNLTITAAQLDFDPYKNMLDILHWNSMDAFTSVLVAGSAWTPSDSCLTIATASISSGTSCIRSKDYTAYGPLLSAGKVFVIEWILNITPSSPLGALHMQFTSNNAGSVSLVTNHIGFTIDASNNILASSGDGTQESTDTTIDGPTTADFVRLRAVWTVGTNVLFYVNDVLRATHATHIPAANAVMANWIGTVTTSGGVTTYKIGRILMTCDY